MNFKFAALLVLTAAGAVACSNDPAPSAEQASSASASPASQQPEPRSASERAAEQSSAAAPAAAPAERSPARSEPVELAQAETSAAPSGRFSEGTHYQRLTPAQSTSTGAGQVEVAEVFMYSCPACFAFEPYIQEWLKTKPDYVNFVRIPAAWNDLARVHAQAFYTAEALGKLEEISEPFFQEIHVNRNALDSQAALRTFFARFGVDAETFDNTFESFAVHTKLRRADDLIRRYRVAATPTMVVNGKYVTNGQMAGSYEAWFDIIDELAAAERSAASN